MSDERLEPTAEQLISIILEKTIDRCRILRSSGAAVDFNECARVLAEVINDEVDSGAFITDDMCEQLVGVPDELEKEPA